MKVLHINSYYKGRKFYKNFFDQQIRDNLDIDVFVPVYSLPDEDISKFGMYTTMRVNHKGIDRLFYYRKYKKILYDIKQNYNITDYSIIHAHSLFTNGVVAMELKKKYDIPYITVVRNTDVNIFFKWMPHLRKKGREILKNSDRIIFLSQSYRDIVLNNYIKKDMRKKIKDKSVIIPNGIDNFWLKNSGTVKRLESDPLKILYVGEINSNKNILTTIQSINYLRNNNIEVVFSIAGKVKEKKIYNKFKHLNYINYITPKPKEKLINIYRENDIFVMPSINESFGLVYVEAMSQGLPVIYTRKQGFDGHFDEGIVGYSVNPKNPREIANKILKAKNNLNKLSNNSLKYVEKFSWEKLNKRYMDIYSAIFNNN